MPFCFDSGTERKQQKNVDETHIASWQDTGTFLQKIHFFSSPVNLLPIFFKPFGFSALSTFLNVFIRLFNNFLCHTWLSIWQQVTTPWPNGAMALHGHTWQSASESPRHGFAWSCLSIYQIATPWRHRFDCHWHKASGQTDRRTHMHTLIMCLLQFGHTVILQIFGVVLFSVFSVVKGFTENKMTPKCEKYIERSRQHPRTPKFKRHRTLRDRSPPKF